MYDVIVIGAGPAGLFAAYELSKELKVLVIEKGNEIKRRICPLMLKKVDECRGCRECSILSGVGGAGLFSDGKLNLIPTLRKTNLYEFLSKKQANDLIKYIDDILVGFGAPQDTTPKNHKKAVELKKKAKKLGVEFLIIKQKHIGSDKLPTLINLLVDVLKQRDVEFLLNSEVTDLVVERNRIKGVKCGNKFIEARSVLAAPGRVGSQWIVKQAKKLGIGVKQRGLEVGVRVELKYEAMKKITENVWDPTFIIKSDRHKDEVRTFCTCPGGFVTTETYDHFSCTNGYCRRDKVSQNTNFAFLSDVTLTHPVEDTIYYGESIGKLAKAIGDNNPILQRYNDLKMHRRSTWTRIRESSVKPTLKDVTPGDISMAMPNRIVDNIEDGLEKLNKVIPGILNDALLYAPEIKFFSERIETNKKLETSIRNLYVAGDGPGVCGNIIGAAATGVIAANNIVYKFSTKKLKKKSKLL